MPRPKESGRERREKTDKFQTFNRPKIKIARTAESGKVYIDYKDTESLRKMLSGNGKIQSRKRTGTARRAGVARSHRRNPVASPICIASLGRRLPHSACLAAAGAARPPAERST